MLYVIYDFFFTNTFIIKKYAFPVKNNLCIYYLILFVFIIIYKRSGLSDMCHPVDGDLICLIFIRELLACVTFMCVSYLKVISSALLNPTILLCSALLSFTSTHASNHPEHAWRAEEQGTEAWWETTESGSVSFKLCFIITCRYAFLGDLLCFPWCSSNADTSDYFSCDVAARTMTASANRA